MTTRLGQLAQHASASLAPCWPRKSRFAPRARAVAICLCMAGLPSASALWDSVAAAGESVAAVGEHVGGAVLDGGAAIADTSAWAFEEASEHLDRALDGLFGQPESSSAAAPATAFSLSPSPSVPAACLSTADGCSFATSRYKRLYTEMPRVSFAYELQRALHAFVRACASHPSMELPGPEADAFFGQLLGEALAAGGISEMLDEAALSRFAVRVWTSQQQWGGREFCSLLNQAVREDGALAPATLRPAVVLCRAINDVLCCSGRTVSASAWPGGPGSLPPLLGQLVSAGWSSEVDTTFRGGALPAEHESFFSVGRRFRTAMFVATSFDEAVARQFMARVPADVQPVLWRVRFDPVRRCIPAC